jgi:hypothetical protein
VAAEAVTVVVAADAIAAVMKTVVRVRNTANPQYQIPIGIPEYPWKSFPSRAACKMPAAL